MKALKHLFQAFLRSRHAMGLFRRNALPSGTAAHRSVSPTLTRELLRASRDDISAVLARTGSSEDGLTREQARAALTRFGPNEVEHEKPLPAWLHLWYCYRNPFNLLLTLLAVVSYATEDMKAAIVIASMVLLSTLLRFVQEGRSNRAAARLKAMVSSTATVLRRNGGPHLPADVEAPDAQHSGFGQQARRYEVPLREVVPGDFVVLSAGDMIPADCRVLSAKDLFVSQSAMTGESLPVEKRADAGASNGAGVLEASNLLFMGTNVVSGTALAVVLATGNRSYFGTIATRVTASDRTPTAFETGVNSVSWLLIRFAAVMVPVVLFINGYTKGDADPGSHRAGAPHRRLRPALRRDAALCLPQQPLPDRPEEPAGPRRARTRGTAHPDARGRGLPQGGRNPLRLRAPPHVRGGGRARTPPRTDLQGRGRGNPGRLHPAARR
jgi:Mg2+-importing ATPase